jgi:5-oxoprolinase (ATP-hydrolysing)
MPGRALVIEAISAEAIGQTQSASEAAPVLAARPAGLLARAQVHAWMDDADRETGVYYREDLRPGDVITGPAIIKEPIATTVVEPEWRALVTPLNHLVLERTQVKQRAHAIGTTADPVLLEVFNNLFMAIAEQMGVTLANTSYSVNIKERLDFSCAIFDPEGNLVANAPHMPVHLGSMGESVRVILEKRAGQMKPGDAFVLNAPYAGGTHIPDVTVVTPVFLKGESSPLFYTAARGHHADIGGITPGSMPPFSTHISEEGVLLDNVQLVREGIFLEDELTAILTHDAHPVRNVTQNIADLRAQVAACAKGAHELAKMVGHFSLPVVRAYMRHVQDNAEESVRRVLGALRDGKFDYEMDDGSVIRVAIRVDRARREATIDFTGTSPQRPTNFNAPSAVCKAAVLYVFRTLVDDDIAQGPKEGRPPFVARQQRVVEQVGIGEHVGRVLAYPAPFLGRGVPVVGGHPEPRQGEPPLVPEGLPGGRSRRNHHVPARSRGLGCLPLVTPQVRHSGLGERGRERRGEPVGQGGGARRAGRQPMHRPQRCRRRADSAGAAPGGQSREQGGGLRGRGGGAHCDNRTVAG